ncbi:MAG: HAD hydrolase-like protein [Streptosporangiales bacterium]|nr:HAD hydrolase-like protein [Streptosporangiales bacterium]
MSPGAPIHRLVLWSIDRTLVDVGRITRDAYAEAFQRVVDRPLVRLAPSVGRTDSEVIFETLALNGVDPTEHHLPEFTRALADAFARRSNQLVPQGRLLPGARESLAALQHVPGVVQTVLTGNIRANAIVKLTAFGLDRHLDLEIGGYGSENFPLGTLLQVARRRAAEKYGAPFDESTTVLITDAAREVSAARIGGAAVIGISSGHNTQADLRAAGADVVLADLQDNAAVVRSVEELAVPFDRRTG